MHLQLTAMEHLLPLFHDKLLTYNVFSPWKGEGRNERGLLHAVYVFSNIKKFWLKVHAQSKNINDFAVKRINEIQKELSTAGHILKKRCINS
ncbi:aKG-HExxH-type peptide beta-hydroxylase [Enterobacter cloacae complex sp. 301C7]|uniref:aKG-HExxH-type peptide beta-hydroxylase n=1 Tax=Enterobacter cloacae complex sp. 301C7 TaxID=3395848 RepID=UPI003CFB3AD4